MQILILLRLKWYSQNFVLKFRIRTMKTCTCLGFWTVCSLLQINIFFELFWLAFCVRVCGMPAPMFEIKFSAKSFDSNFAGSKPAASPSPTSWSEVLANSFKLKFAFFVSGLNRNFWVWIFRALLNCQNQKWKNGKNDYKVENNCWGTLIGKRAGSGNT